MAKTLCLFTLAFSLLGCSAAFVPATSDPEKKLAQAYQLLSVYRPKPARRLIDESIEIYKQKGDKEGLAQAYLVSTDYYRYVASDAYRQFTGEPTLTVKPIPRNSVYGVRTERVWTAHKLAEEAYKQIISDAIAEKNHLKASANYMWLSVLYARNRQKLETCEALNGELNQFNLAKAAKPNLNPYVDPSNSRTVADEVEGRKKALECSEP
jgi:hypothetical protein